MALVNKNEGLKEEYPMEQDLSAEYDFSCVRQIARADRFPRVLTRAIARVKRKGLHHVEVVADIITITVATRSIAEGDG